MVLDDGAYRANSQLSVKAINSFTVSEFAFRDNRISVIFSLLISEVSMFNLAFKKLCNAFSNAI